MTIQLSHQLHTCCAFTTPRALPSSPPQHKASNCSRCHQNCWQVDFVTRWSLNRQPTVRRTQGDARRSGASARWIGSFTFRSGSSPQESRCYVTFVEGELLCARLPCLRQHCQTNVLLAGLQLPSSQPVSKASPKCSCRISRSTAT